ncbi:hypothetical protein ACVW00_001219 [Marmoricola sp. URHA0025 HA25]
MKRSALKLAAVIGAAAVSTLAVAPVFAAAPVSQATAKALELNIAGNNITDGLGQVKATNDGATESKTGPTNPPISVLKNQGLLNVGALVQEAQAKVTNGDGTSAACSGVAGNGGTGSLAEVGDSSCITPGSPVGISLANLDLSNVITINPASALGPLAALNNPLQLILGSITAPLSSALQSALGNLSLGGSLGAIEAHCTANPTSATGDANLASTTGNSNTVPITLSAAGQDVVIASLPVNPPPNTHVLTNLSTVTQAIVDGVNQELHQALVSGGNNGPLAPLAGLTQSLQDTVIKTLADSLKPLLQPLEDNVLNITLNKQSKGDNGRSVDVTAIDLQLLPAAAGALGFSAVSADIAHVTCGPNTRVATPSTPNSPNTPKSPHTPKVPTVVDSGLAGHQDHTARNVLGATAALMLLAGTAGLVGYRRMLHK